MILTVAFMAAGWAATVAVFARHLDRARREHARREDLLVNQVCALAGRPWLPPPADDVPALDLSPESHDWIGDPEQALV